MVDETTANYGLPSPSLPEWHGATSPEGMEACMGRGMIAVGFTLAALLLGSLPAATSAAPAPPRAPSPRSSGQGNPTQTGGSATFHGTSAPCTPADALTG